MWKKLIWKHFFSTAINCGRNKKTGKKSTQQKEALVRDVISLKESMKKDWKILQQVEEKRNRVTALFQCANGTGNQQKLALETYVLQHYFHRVLAAANLRLDQLTMGRYRLVADEDREKHGGRSGLGIDVMDSFNEQHRSVRTFSGGEKIQRFSLSGPGSFLMSFKVKAVEQK